ncbi:MAG TPA: ABC transporter permease DevC [Gemmataceae bacterium]|jgi:putative ABC transport system permease protein
MANLLAVRNLAHNKVRTGVAIGGVCFAVTLLLMQLGFFATVSMTAMQVYDALEFDIVLLSPHYVVLTQTGTFPRERLFQARAWGQVESVSPLYVSRQMWRNPETRFQRAVVTLGVNPSDPVCHSPELREQCRGLAIPDTALIDRLSRPEVGALPAGQVTEVGTRNIEIIGQFEVGPGFEAGVAIVGDQTYARLIGRPLREVSVGLVKLRSGADARKVAEELRDGLPADVHVLTRAELADKERRYWIVSTSTGIIFGCGVLVAILFGIVITYQVLSLEVMHRLSEYATLKALGFSDGYLSGIVLQQAVIFAVVSYIPGFLIAMVIYYVGSAMTRLPMSMTVERAATVFVVNLLLCCLSGLLALRILRRADPVDLF